MNCFRLFTLPILCFLLYPQQVQSEELTLAVDDYCPYYCRDQQASPPTFLQNPGYIIEILNYAFVSKGYQLNYLFIPWERGLVELHKNTMDGIIVSSKHDAPELIFPQNEQGRSVGCFVTRKHSTWQFSDKASLEEILLGVVQGYNYGEPVGSYVLQAYSTQNHISFIAGIQALSRLLNMVDKGRIDATIDDKNVLLYTIEKEQLQQNLKISTCIQTDILLYVAFSPANPEAEKYANILSNAMDELRTSGKLDDILAKYNIVDWY